ncbi:response regulator [Cohnella sp. LGH]|uniref:response regulator n=1 Tax=Cohnella sp. LGH TaxID=1619153 RepID=UPI001ADBCF7A|nr:response regulator [Cohnella sp. LGH]QTH43607.1 response regulator [Cohnella sp. LGH]
MLRALLIDDEEIALDVLEILLREIGGVEVVGKFGKVFEAVDQAESLKPDLIFLDIEMPGMNGLAAGELLSGRCPEAEIVFVTAYHQYALEAFDKNAIGYLLKPVAKDRLRKTIERYETLRKKAARRAAAPLDQAELRASDQPPQSVSPHKLNLKAMGSLELYDGEGRLVTWRTRKTKELFAYLWNHGGEPVYRYHILDHLWPEVDSERAKALFHTTLYNVRNMLRAEGFADMVAFGDERYWMHTDRVSSDTERLDVLMRRGNLEDADELLALYRGDYLDTEHYDWANSRRGELRATYVRHLDRLAEEADGSGPVLGRLLWKLLELDPYRSGVYERLLRHQLEVGDAASIRKLEGWKRQLDGELADGSYTG